MKLRVSRRKRWRSRWVLFGALLGTALVVLLTTEGALASREHQRVVVLSRDATPGSLEASFVSALRIYLTELELALDVRSSPTSANPFDVVAELRASNETSNALLVAWIVPQKPRIIVYIYEPKGPRLRARAVSISDSSLAASEELALILRSSILARREGGDLEMAEVILPSTAAAPQTPQVAANAEPIVPQPRATETASTSDFGLGLYAGSSYARVISDGGGNTGLGLRLFGQIGRTRFGLGYVVLPASTWHSELAKFTVNRHPLQAYWGRHLVGDRLRLVSELAIVADPMRRRTDWAEVPLESQPPTWRWGWTLTGLLRGEAHLFSGMWLSGGVGAEIALNPFSYEQIWLEDRQTLARILPVRPVLELGFAWVTR